MTSHSRGDDRPYKVVYSTRSRDLDPESVVYDDPGAVPRQKPRREVGYGYGYEYDSALEKSSYSRDYRDDKRSRAVEQTYAAAGSSASASASAGTGTGGGGGTTKIKYEVGRARDSDASVYVKRSNALVIERPRNNAHTHPRPEYEVVRPERRDDGSYVVDLGGRRVRDHGDRDLDSSDTFPSRASYYEAPKSSSGRHDVVMYEASRPAARDRDRAGPPPFTYYKDVEIVEDTEDDHSDLRYRRGRRPEKAFGPVDGNGGAAKAGPPPPRRKSAMRGRNNTPPEIVGSRRRSQSVGFYRDQISDHDAGERRHERPGAEAHLAGRYLRSHPTDDDHNMIDDDGYDDGYGRAGRSRPLGRGREGSGSRYDAQRSDLRLNDYEYDNDRRTYTEETVRRYEYEDGQPPAPPGTRLQLRHSDTHTQTRRRDRDRDRDWRDVDIDVDIDDDHRRAYSGYEAKSRREYYR